MKRAVLFLLPCALVASIFAGSDRVGAVHGVTPGPFGAGVQPVGAGQ